MREEVLRIGQLANLHIGEEELDEYAHELKNILDLVGRLDEISNEYLDVAYESEEHYNVLRPDSFRPFPEPERIISATFNRKNGFFQVPPGKKGR